MNFKEGIASKTFFWSLLNIVLVIVVIFGLKVLLFRGPLVTPLETLTVSAEGKTTVSPDLATISFSVVTEGKDPKVIQTQNTQKMNSALEFVKAQGIASKDIKTTNYSLYPKYYYPPVVYGVAEPKEPTITGYTITQSVQVKIRDFEKIATILGGLTEKGINQIDTVQLSVEDPDKYLNDARDEAFDKARAKADEMARANGLRVRRVITFSESTGGYPMFLRADAVAYGKGGGPETAPAPQIEPGSQDVTVQVSVTYEIH